MRRFGGVVKHFQLDKVLASDSHIENMRWNVELNREPHIFTLISNNQTDNIRISILDAFPLDFHSEELGRWKIVSVFNLGVFLELFWSSDFLHINFGQVFFIVCKINLFVFLIFLSNDIRNATENTFERIASLTEDKID